MIGLFACQVHGDQGFAALWPRLILDHPHGAWAFTQQMPVGRGKNDRFQSIVLMRHFQHQIVTAGDNLLDDGLKGTIVPDHFNFNGDTGFKIIFRLLTYPGCALAYYALTHCGAFVRRKQGGHLIREIVNRQESFNFAANPLMQINCSP